MKQLTVAALVLFLLLGGVTWWYASIEPSTVSPKNGSSSIPGAGVDVTPQSNPEESAAARQRVADAELALQAAIAERQAAETEMQKSEREVEDLERWIEDIEARGEDPADHADEGLARLQPAFYAYQDAFDRYELAETVESTAAEELAAARQDLARIIAATDGQK